MRIRFWGVRGSIPCPGKDTVVYGGNTACVEIQMGAVGRRMIIDAGSGIRELGNQMVAEDLPKGPLQADVFLSHTHWDHIMGFPFFTPIFIPGTVLNIYGPVTYEDETLGEVLNGQWTYRYFPIRQEELSSSISYHDLKETELDLGDGIQLTTKYLNHPLLCLGYRFEYRDRVIVTAYDTEPFRNVFCTDPQDPNFDEAMAAEGELVAAEENQRIVDFCQGADLLIHDAQYTEAEYQSGKLGWGHSSIEYAISLAQRAGVKQLALFHHDPMRSDELLTAMSDQFCKADTTEAVTVFFAREGHIIEIPSQSSRV
jgi:phosphoribosyl 1,2-cyclic phosphodiesterase